ncbi:MAG: cyclic nucleotide-binding domain-containing protein [Candidatus Binatia bacterium]
MSTLDLFRNARDFESYSAGHIVFHAGDPGNKMYIVKEGEVEIIINDKVIETVGPSGVVGEMALIDSRPRSATVRAKTDCQLVPIDEKRFTFLIQQTPYFSLQVMRVLVERVRKMDAHV